MATGYDVAIADPDAATVPDAPLGPVDGSPDRALDSGAGGVDTSAGEVMGDYDGGSRGVLALLAGSIGGPGHRDGVGTAARFDLPAAITGDGAGHLFVADKANNVIRQIDLATSAVTTLAGSPPLGNEVDAGAPVSVDGVGAAARFSGLAGITCDKAGNLFVVDNNAIRQIVISTGAVTTIAGSPGNIGKQDATGTDARFYNPVGIASDGAGNLFIADSSSCAIRRLVLATRVVTTFAGNLFGGAGDTDGQGPSASFSYPQDIVSDGAGDLFVAEGSRIRRIVVATGMVSTLELSTRENHGDVPMPVSLSSAWALASDEAGNLFVAEGSRIRRIALTTSEVTTLAGEISSDRYADGTALTARFNRPQGLVSDGAGSLFVADSGNHVIRKIDTATAAVTTLAGAPGALGHQDGPGAVAQFAYPRGLATDNWGNLFVADGDIRQIVLATQTVFTFAGVSRCGALDGSRALAQLSAPGGLACDGTGSLFVADTYGKRIRRIDEITGEVSTLLAESIDPCPWDIIGGAIGVDQGPAGLVSDGAGNLFFADSAQHTIRQLAIATGTVTTLAGSPGAAGSSDGVGEAARFASPWGVASDGTGGLLVTDTGNHTIRRIGLGSGSVTTLAGSPGVTGGSDGAGPAARFNRPTGIAGDGEGNFFVADADNCSIRKLALATGAVTTVVGSPGQCSISVGPLPAQLGHPRGLAFLPPGNLFIATSAEKAGAAAVGESAILVARF